MFRFWGVFWLDASSESSLERGFIEIAEKCHLHDKSFEGARSWLQETSHSWLLILDNADDPNIDYAVYLPAAPKGHIIMTSRVKECALLQTAGADRYESLSEETAVELLLKACDIDSSLYNAHADEALEIVDLLGRHALAIHQAGASIRNGICDLRDYKNTFNSQRQRLLRIRPNQARSQYGDVYATFEVSATYLNGLSGRGDQTATDALELLNFYAFMSFTKFPEKAFEVAWRNSNKTCRGRKPGTEERIDHLSPWHKSHLPGFIRQESAGGLDMISLREAQCLLASLSILALDSIEHTTSMHPVTHMWARDRLEKQKNCTNAWLEALTILCCSIRNPYVQEDLWVQLQPHIELIERFPPGDNLSSDQFHLHQSFFRLSWVLHKLRADKAVIEMLQTCFIGKDQSWIKLPYSAEIGYLYGRCLRNFGDTKQATKMLEYVVQIREKLAEDHPDRLASHHALALAYQADGNIEKAIELLEYVVKINKERKLAKDHPHRLASQHALAIAYYANGQIEEAIELLEHIVTVGERGELAKDHPSRLASHHELARAYHANGKIEEAIELFEHVVHIREEKLAVYHPSRLASQHALARAYHTNGQIEEAIKLLKHIVKIKDEKLAKYHPSRLRSQRALAEAYRAKGQVDKAVEIEGRLREISRERSTTDI